MGGSLSRGGGKRWRVKWVGRELRPACKAQGARPYAEEVGWADPKSDGVSANPSAQAVHLRVRDR